MKLLILSDIHSNIYALNAIWEKESDADKIYSAGDLTDYGPFPHEVISWFQEHNVQTVMGNHDRNLINVYESLNGDVSALTGEDFRWVHYNCERLSLEEIEYLKSLPTTLDFEADGYYYRISHQFDQGYGRPQNISQFESFLDQKPVKNNSLPIRLIFGHTHRQAICHFRGNRLWMNPGSVSYRRPDDPEKSAHYAVIEDGEISLRSVEYDRTPLLEPVMYLAENQLMEVEHELKVAFFFFGSAPDTQTEIAESLAREKKLLK